MKYFVTGATGFIGGKLARELVRRGHEVVALVRTPSKAQDLTELGITVVEGDITAKDSMRTSMTGVDGVYHIAAWYKVGVKNDRAQQINVDGTRNVLELMQELNISKGVYTSTLAVFSDTGGKVVDESYYFDGQHLSEYDRTKWEAHYNVAVLMQKAGLPLVIVQPGLVYGPDDTSTVRDTLIQYLQRKLPMIPKGAAYCWAHVDDIVEGHILAMEKGIPGETYIIAGEPYTLTDAMKLAQDITGIAPPRMQAPPALMKMMSGIMSVVNRVVTVPEQYHPESLRVFAGKTYLGDNAKARRELGYNPRPLREGLRQLLEHEMQLLGMQPKH